MPVRSSMSDCGFFPCLSGRFSKVAFTHTMRMQLLAQKPQPLFLGDLPTSLLTYFSLTIKMNALIGRSKGPAENTCHPGVAFMHFRGPKLLKDTTERGCRKTWLEQE